MSSHLRSELSGRQGIGSRGPPSGAAGSAELTPEKILCFLPLTEHNARSRLAG